MPKKLNNQLPELKLIDNKTTGERLAGIRKNKGFSQVQLAEKVGVIRTTIADYEAGRSRIYDEMITRLSIALEITPGELLGLSETIKNEENISLRYTKRIKEIEKLPEHKKRVILKMIDDSIKANKG